MPTSLTNALESGPLTARFCVEMLDGLDKNKYYASATHKLRHVSCNIFSHPPILAHLHKCTHTLIICSHRPMPTCQCCIFSLLNLFFFLIFLFDLTVHVCTLAHAHTPVVALLAMVSFHCWIFFYLSNVYALALASIRAGMHTHSSVSIHADTHARLHPLMHTCTLAHPHPLVHTCTLAHLHPLMHTRSPKPIRAHAHPLMHSCTLAHLIHVCIGYGSQDVDRGLLVLFFSLFLWPVWLS